METVLYFVFWGLLIFLMMRFGCGSHMMGHGHGHSRQGTGEPPAGKGGVRWVPPAKDVDPVCGMTVETAGAKSAVFDGTVYYFCSTDCRDKFEVAPASYVRAPATASGEEHHHAAHH